MNLWVRTLRQLTILSVALIFFSCQDETSLLGFKNPKKKFNVHFIDIPLSGSPPGVVQVLAIDSLITDLRPFITPNGQLQTVDGMAVGQYQDPDFGKVTVQPFLSVYPVSNAALNSTAVFDSITVQFRLNFYAYAFAGQQQFNIPVHEITGDTLTFFGGNRYYANSIAPEYGVDPLGEAKITVDYDHLLYEADSASNAQDTLLLSGRLSDEYGLRVFNAIKGGFADGGNKLFRATIKGITLLPGAEPGVLGMNVIGSQFSRVNVHYHTLTEAGAVDDTLAAALGFEYASFTRMDADRTGTELAALAPYESFEPLSNQRYIQSGTPVITKIDLAPFYGFADTVENILVNSAELVIDNVTAPPGLDPHDALVLRLMNNNSNQFLNSRIAADREIATGYYTLSGTTDGYYFAATETSSPAAIIYDDQEDRFSGFMTLFVQSLFTKKNDEDGINDNRLRYVALVPASPPVNRGVTRTLFNKDDLRLRIYYTRANTVVP